MSFMGPESTLPCSQEPSTGRYVDLLEPSPDSHALFKIHFNIIFPFASLRHKWSRPSGFQDKTVQYSVHFSPMRATCADHYLQSLNEEKYFRKTFRSV
jgi:hypothetical protein